MIPAECHHEQLFISNESLFNVDQHYWISYIFLNALCSLEISAVASINEMEVKRV